LSQQEATLQVATFDNVLGAKALHLTGGTSMSTSIASTYTRLFVTFVDAETKKKP